MIVGKHEAGQTEVQFVGNILNVFVFWIPVGLETGEVLNLEHGIGVGEPLGI